MNINNEFYSTINELVSRASRGVITDIVDYDSFIDSGKKINELDNPDEFRNAFCNAIANKVQLSLDTARSYQGKYAKLIRGSVAPGGVIELITHLFYETREAAFVSLENDQSVDQWIINKGDTDVAYFTKSNSYQIPVTIQYTELEGAFTSPERMQIFLNNKITYALNSNELAREVGRIGLIADLLVELSSANAGANDNDPAMRYPLVTMYNDIYSDTLTADNCLYNTEFIRFACMVIKKVSDKLTKVSTSYNRSGIKTFTPADDKLTFINGAFTSAMTAYLRPVDYRPEYSVIPDGFENVPYWQDENNPLTVSYGEDETKTPPVIALIVDNLTLGEYVEHERVLSTTLNARGEYYNTFINVQTKYISNKNANSVIFTLE